MARNFRVYIYRNAENLHLALNGDFDGASAHELIDALKNNVIGVYTIFIHTNGLSSIEPSGRELFHRNLLTLDQHRPRILFTGENAYRLAVDGTEIC